MSVPSPWWRKATPDADACLLLFLNSLNCKKEYLVIYDGPLGSDNYEKICYELSVFHRSSSNVMTIKYSREPSHPATFFEVYYFGETNGK